MSIKDLKKEELRKLNKEILSMRSKDALNSKLTKGFKNLLNSVDFTAQLSKK